MARVVLSYQFADGEVIQSIVDGKTSYPDALSQLKHEAVEGFKEAFAYALAIQRVPIDEDEA